MQVQIISEENKACKYPLICMGILRIFLDYYIMDDPFQWYLLGFNQYFLHLLRVFFTIYTRYNPMGSELQTATPATGYRERLKTFTKVVLSPVAIMGKTPQNRWVFPMYYL